MAAKQRPSVVALRRGRITERVGEATASDQFPNKTPKNRELSKQVDDKRRVLERLVANVDAQRKSRADVESFIKQLQSNRDAIHQHRATHAEDLVDLRARMKELEKGRAKIRREASGVDTSATLENGEKKKTMDSIAIAENTLEKLEKKLGASAAKTDALSTATAAQESSNKRIREDLEKDAKAVKQLEDYLKRTMESTFNEQKRLDDYRLGMKNQPAEIEGMKRRLKEEKARARKNREQLEISLKSARKADELNKAASRVATTEAELKAELEETRKEHAALRTRVNAIEAEWISLQDELSSAETALAEAKAHDKVAEAKQRRYETKIEILRLEPPPTIYRNYENILEGQKKMRAKKKGLDLSLPDDSSEEAMKTERLKRKRRVELECARTAEHEKTIFGLKERLAAIAEEDEGDSSDGMMSERDDDRIEADQRKPLRSKSLRSLTESDTSSSSKGSKNVQGRRSSLEKRRDMLVRSREQDAATVFEGESAEAERLHRENVALEARIAATAAEMAKIDRDKVAYRDNIGAVRKKAEGRAAEKEREEEKMRKRNVKKQSEVRSVVSRLTADKRELEREKNELRMKITAAKQESTNLSHAFKSLQSWQKNTDFEGNRKLGDTVREWRGTVDAAEKDLEALTNLVEDARAANGAAKNDLAITKAYEAEQAIFAQLKDREKFLARKANEEKSRIEGRSLTNLNASQSFIGDRSRSNF